MTASRRLASATFVRTVREQDARASARDSTKERWFIRGDTEGMTI